MTEEEACELLERVGKRYNTEAAIAVLNAVALGKLTNAVRSVAHGGVSGPSGLEMLAMAISGEGVKSSLADPLSRLADAVTQIAEGNAERGSGSLG